MRARQDAVAELTPALDLREAVAAAGVDVTGADIGAGAAASSEANVGGDAVASTAASPGTNSAAGVDSDALVTWAERPPYLAAAG